ncbi:MAG: S41 family peptidase [Alistipes sp.]
MKIKFWMLAAVFAAIGMASCSSDDPETPVDPPVPEEGDEVAINKMVDKYMSSHYLWNTEYNTLTPDYNLTSDAFLKKGLEGVAAQNKANEEDGYFDADGKHHWYTYITKTKAGGISGASRAGEDVRFGYGFSGVSFTKTALGSFIGILGVIKESPAAKTAIPGTQQATGRGMFITKVDGTAVTASNYNSLKAKLFPKNLGSSVKLTLVNIKWNDASKNYEVENLGVVTLKAGNYDYNPILFEGVIGSPKDPNVKIGYIAYSQFLMGYDENLIKTFEVLNYSAGGKMSDLILDLRYNQGGHLLSSAVLGTLVVGDAYKDAVYCSAQYNADRAVTEKPRVYKIGNKMTGEGEYSLVEKALAASANLKRVYVLTGLYTASASELIINGLRGLDVEVRLIGEKTNGKNVGMEGKAYNGGNGYIYEFYPITMRLQNAKNFSAYSKGFEPDVLVPNSDVDFYIGAYASYDDPLSGYAITWILNDEKPNPSSANTKKCTRTSTFSDVTILEPLYKGAITCPEAL